MESLELQRSKKTKTKHKTCINKNLMKAPTCPSLQYFIAKSLYRLRKRRNISQCLGQNQNRDLRINAELGLGRGRVSIWLGKWTGLQLWEPPVSEPAGSVRWSLRLRLEHSHWSHPAQCCLIQI